MRIAMVQDDCIVGEKDKNYAKAIQYTAQAAYQKADIIIFPELFLTGYCIHDRLFDLAESIDGSYIQKLAKAALDYGIYMFMGFPEIGDNKIYNSLICLSNQGKIISVYRKIHLYDLEVDYFEKGMVPIVVNTPWGKIGLSICYDMEFPELSRFLALHGAELLVIASANMDPWCTHQVVYSRARAMENQIYLALSNRIGSEGRNIFCGNSIIVDPFGRVLISAGKNNTTLLVTDIDMGEVFKVRNESVNYLSERRSDLFGNCSK